MSNASKKSFRPAILAPAGNRASFLAAIAAGADAIYCGLKQFSARMEAENFSVEELAALTMLARKEGTKVYVTLNTLLRPRDLNVAGGLLQQLAVQVKPDGVIVHDLAYLPLIKQTGYSGKIHLSTLANVSFGAALELIRKRLHVDGIVLPRELNIDEIKTVAALCPKGIDLEVFVHGALCYGVSGRCYWSSYFGGKSGLRGRCVQPCRRIYTQQEQRRRYFSCLDLSLDVLVKVLRDIPQVKSWKIEGRKKGPHYVFYTVTAYRLLRDQANDPKMKKTALQLLGQALGRPGTHYYFLPQRPQNPVGLNRQTASGYLVGRIKGPAKKPYLIPTQELMPGDLLRIGYQDEPWHGLVRIGSHVPKGGRFYLQPLAKSASGKKVPVFLTDRQEKVLIDKLSSLEKTLQTAPESKIYPARFNAKYPTIVRKKRVPFIDLRIHRTLRKPAPKTDIGLWLSATAAVDLSNTVASRIWWWLPPVIWPEEEEKVQQWITLVQQKGGRRFVLNAPWQMTFFHHFKTLTLWAGPFCNITNSMAVGVLASLGFKGAIVSPELDEKDYIRLPKHSPLPLGIVVSGNWPLCVARACPDKLIKEAPFFSPKGEAAWVQQIDANYWIFPNWKLNLHGKQGQLKKAGYRLFTRLLEPVPKEIKFKKRPGLWNWELKLL